MTNSKRNLDLLIADNFKKFIKRKYKTVEECSLKHFTCKKYLNNVISNIRKKGKYPSIPRIKEIAKFCDCEFIDFFKIDNK